MAFGKYAVDFEERVNFQHLREERLEKAKEQLSRDGLGGRCNLGSRYDSIHLVSLYHHALEGDPKSIMHPAKERGSRYLYCRNRRCEA